jgi:2-polyprenyl-6-methoxyphenol hydroxylase-like FAD-dependent oxidoreductase
MIGQLQRMGLLMGLTSGLLRGETVTVARRGRIVANIPTVNFGLRYEDLVNRARAVLPRSVKRITGKAVEVVTSDSIQTVRLADGTSLECRVIIMATGQGHALARQVGIERRMLREGHSLTFGFGIEPGHGRAFHHNFIVYQRESVRSRIDYLAAFALNGTTRVNLFTYRDYKEPWTRAFVSDPTAALHAALPQLARVLGSYRVAGPVDARPIDLYAAQDYRKDGVVLIGDVFQASCPATGMGVVRLLTDVERLMNVHLPKWLRTPGMSAAKLSSFYDDPVKRACDAKALHDSEYRRSLSTDPSLAWALHRARLAVQERARVWLHRAPGQSTPRVEAAHAAGSFAPG